MYISAASILNIQIKNKHILYKGYIHLLLVEFR